MAKKFMKKLLVVKIELVVLILVKALANDLTTVSFFKTLSPLPLCVCVLKYLVF